MTTELRELQRMTVEYWHKLKASKNKADVFEGYLQNLLPEEIEYAKSRSGAWPSDRADVLVLLVGFSIEPLLQSICAYQPQDVLLVVNRKYQKEGDGVNFVNERLVDWIEDLVPRLLEDMPMIRPQPLRLLPQETPGEVFRFLLKELRDDLKQKRRVVVDITGSKKSLMSGAFFFAAYTGADISYVDFDGYAESERRPYGYSCRIGPLPNPYDIFSLRDWEQVKQLYEHYAFDAAADLLKSIVSDMSLEYFERDQIETIESIQQIMDSYHAWANGDYRQAHERDREIGQQVNNYQPLVAVQSLHTHWPQEIDPVHPESIENLYDNRDLLLVYAQDELLKIQKIVYVKEDYRSGFLRAAGLNEVLLKARVWGLVHANLLDISREVQKPDGTKEIKRATSKQIQRMVKGINSEQALIIASKGKWEPTLSKRKHYIEKNAEAPELLVANAGDVGLDQIRKIRNELTHAVLPVSQQLAANAVTVTEENLQDFRDRWAALIPSSSTTMIEEGVELRSEPPTWGELCTWCGIDFLPVLEEKSE